MKKKQLKKLLRKTNRNTEIILRINKIYYPITDISFQETSDGNSYLVLESKKED